MVKFKLFCFNDEKVTYEYYPEGNTDETPGIIVFSKTDLSVQGFVSSIDDTYIHLSDDFLDCEADNIFDNNSDDNGFYVYAQHAIRRILELYNKENKFPDQGMSMWY